MQFISAKPLIEKFKANTFEESEVGSYFMAFIIFTAVAMIPTVRGNGPLDVAVGISTVLITIFGVLHLKGKNQETFGNHFVAKYFCLGWVITVRMFLIGMPMAVVLFTFAKVVGGRDGLAAMGALFAVGYQILFYGWLGILIFQSNTDTD